MDRWCAARRVRRGGLVTIDQAFRLAQIWYAGRHKCGWRPRDPMQTQAIFDFLDLTDPFWRVV